MPGDFGYLLGLFAALTGGSSIVYGIGWVKDDKRLVVVGLGFAAVTFGLWMISSSS